MRWSFKDISRITRGRVFLCLTLVVLAFTVRYLTAEFIREHITDAAWFPYGIYAIFDNQAQDVLDGKSSAFWAGDALTSPRAATSAVYPPGYSLWLAFIYQLTGERSAIVVQSVQYTLDSLFILLIVGAGASLYGWRVGFTAGLLTALSPLMAFYGATPLADSPTAWIVVGGAWMMLLAAKRLSWRYALGAGLMIGASCWLRANALLLGVWCAIALFLFVKASWPVRLRLSAVFMLGMLLLVAPVVVRNSLAFHAFVPGGMGFGTNLWEGLGETARGVEYGAIFGDANVIERERAEMDLPKDAPLELYWPDGLQRDRARMNKALMVIRAHPFWFASLMTRRMMGMLKYAGEPVAYMGSAGINVTSRKCLSVEWQGGVLSFAINVLGALQSVLRYLLLPLMLAGAVLGFMRDWRASSLLLSVILYYLMVGSLLHTELRYGLPMQALLFIFAGLAVERIVWSLGSRVWSRKRSSDSRHQTPSSRL